MKDVLSPEIVALTWEDIYVTLIRLFEQLAEKGMVLALDYSKAFDCLDARATAALLRKYKWPPKLLALFELVWTRLDRFVQSYNSSSTHTLWPLEEGFSLKETLWAH